MPNLHCKGGTEVLLKWYSGIYYTDSLMLLRDGINAVTQQLQLCALILGGLVALIKHNLVWILCGITSLD